MFTHGLVVRRFIRQVELRSDDVPYAQADIQSTRRSGLLGMSRGIRKSPREDDRCDRLEDLQDEVHGEELLSVFGTTRQSVQGSSGGNGETDDTEQDG
jgi:hypothetical protein